MRFVSRLDVFLPSDVVERAPTAWDKLRGLWGTVDLATDRARDKVEAATFVYEFRRALDAMQIDDARSLVVDGTTVFHDAQGRDADLPDLLLALSEHVAVFGEACRELCLSVEHEAAGFCFVVDAVVTSEHGRGAPSAAVTVRGHLSDLEPKGGESPEDYRARIESLLSEAKASAIRLQFVTFVARLEAAIGRALPDSRCTVTMEVLDAPQQLAATAAAPAPAQPPRPPRPVAAKRDVETAAPQRNFTLGTEQRIAALVSGPPPYAVRLRRIEDLEDELSQALSSGASRGSIPVAVARKLEELNRLIELHNRYYPIECNLPMDPVSGRLVERGEPWQPRAAATLDALLARARAGR